MSTLELCGDTPTLKIFLELLKKTFYENLFLDVIHSIKGHLIQVKMASKDLIQFYIGLIDYIDNNEDALILLEVFNDINTKWNCIEKLHINDKLFHSSIDKENVYYKSFTKSFINQDLQYEGDLFPEIKNITRVKSVSKVKDNKINLINNVDDFILNKLLMTKNASEIISRLSLSNSVHRFDYYPSKQASFFANCLANHLFSFEERVNAKVAGGSNNNGGKRLDTKKIDIIKNITLQIFECNSEYRPFMWANCINTINTNSFASYKRSIENISTARQNLSKRKFDDESDDKENFKRLK